MTFKTFDGAGLYYRAWNTAGAHRAIVLFHRGHEHSGRFEELAAALDLPGCAIFAWDARGHGQSPGERGWAPSFATLVRDADCFVRHIAATHGIAIADIAVVAHSIGAVLAAAWVHDYAPPIRALVLASPAFEVKLYIPFAIQFLRAQLLVRKKAFVKSYVRPGMLTHDPAEAAAYAADPLISRNVAVNLLVDMRDTAARIVDDAAAIRTPVLLLSAGSDYVVKPGPQRRFFDRLGSSVKEMEVYSGFYHDLFHEKDRARPFARVRDFLRTAFERPSAPLAFTGNEARYEELSKDRVSLMWGAQRLFLRTAGRLSGGIALGWRHGFDSGQSLDYVYRNQPTGITPLGKLIDFIYLNSPGWHGIRQRRVNIEALINAAVARLRGAGKPVHIFDPAAGGGRYILEAVKRLNGMPMRVALRDWSPANVEAAAGLARELKLTSVSVERGDAFDRTALATVAPAPTLAIVSGLYELFPDNARVKESLSGLADAIDDGGYLIYTNQPWHPQLEMIARVLVNREGKRWVMRCRPQAEMDALVRESGFEKVETLTDDHGIFTVTLARRVKC